MSSLVLDRRDQSPYKAQHRGACQSGYRDLRCSSTSTQVKGGRSQVDYPLPTRGFSKEPARQEQRDQETAFQHQTSHGRPIFPGQARRRVSLDRRSRKGLALGRTDSAFRAFPNNSTSCLLSMG